jgi:hypothetical protein
MAGSCEYDNEPSGSVKDRECLDQMRIYEFLTRALLCALLL